MATAEDDNKSVASSEGSLPPLNALGNDDASYASTADEKDDDNKSQQSYHDDGSDGKTVLDS